MALTPRQPVDAALALLISWEKIALSNLFATGALLVLLFALADFARKQGLRIEPGIYNDGTIDQKAKDQYRQFLAGKLGRAAPKADEEAVDQAAADSFYEQSGIWLRDSTRDAKRFPILFGELVSYGFRRNLRGLKWPALAVNLIVVTICVFALWQLHSLDMSDDVITHTIVVLIIAAIHAAYFALAVTKEGVKQAARRYGRELILCCQTLMPGASRASKRASTPTGRDSLTADIKYQPTAFATRRAAVDLSQDVGKRGDK